MMRETCVVSGAVVTEDFGVVKMQSCDLVVEMGAVTWEISVVTGTDGVVILQWLNALGFSQ